MSREFFNSRAEDWDQIVYHDSDKVKRTITGLPLVDNPRILDVGSGTGVLIPFLEDRYNSNVEIYALDYAEKMLEVSREKHKKNGNIKYITGDIYEYPFEEEYFNVVICYSVFPHLVDKKSILEKFKVILKPGGILVIFHSQSRDAINTMHKGAGKEVETDRLPEAKKVVEIAENVGFQVIKVIDNQEMYLVKLKK